jgi:hypothetical protein
LCIKQNWFLSNAKLYSSGSLFRFTNEFHIATAETVEPMSSLEKGNVYTEARHVEIGLDRFGWVPVCVTQLLVRLCSCPLPSLVAFLRVSSRSPVNIFSHSCICVSMKLRINLKVIQIDLFISFLRWTSKWDAMAHLACVCGDRRSNYFPLSFLSWEESCLLVYNKYQPSSSFSPFKHNQ